MEVVYTKINHIYCGDALEILKTLPDNSVDCGVTSPPYYGLRDYGITGQIGLETTPEEYIERNVLVFREFRRVLKPQGTLWVNIGDSYAGSGKGAAHYPDCVNGYKQATNKGTVDQKNIPGAYSGGDIKPKDLIGIPWMLAFALRTDGWYLRNDIIWSKPNPMPESVKDRCTKSHEHIFLFSKSARYYYDAEAIAEPIAESTINDKRVLTGCFTEERPDRGFTGSKSRGNGMLAPKFGENMRNKRSVWTVPISQYKNAHFATYPEELITPCILAGCPQGGIVLDMFFGSGTTGLAAVRNFRNFIGIEINPEYKKMADRRLQPYINQMDMFSLGITN
jgi:DNA modification methylase